MSRKLGGISALSVLGVTLLAVGVVSVSNAKDEAKDVALERTRKTVRMLDDIYKTTVVLITDKYVHDEDDFPAGSAAVALFKSIEKNGWHEVRLIDATGTPRRKKNAPRDEFEKEAVAALKAGQPYFDRVEMREGERHLRALTPVPVVSEKCIMCHEHYKDAKPGEPIGAISYGLKIE